MGLSYKMRENKPHEKVQEILVDRVEFLEQQNKVLLERLNTQLDRENNMFDFVMTLEGVIAQCDFNALSDLLKKSDDLEKCIDSISPSNTQNIEEHIKRAEQSLQRALDAEGHVQDLISAMQSAGLDVSHPDDVTQRISPGEVAARLRRLFTDEGVRWSQQRIKSLETEVDQLRKANHNQYNTIQSQNRQLAHLGAPEEDGVQC